MAFFPHFIERIIRKEITWNLQNIYVKFWLKSAQKRARYSTWAKEGSGHVRDSDCGVIIVFRQIRVKLQIRVLLINHNESLTHFRIQSLAHVMNLISKFFQRPSSCPGLWSPYSWVIFQERKAYWVKKILYLSRTRLCYLRSNILHWLGYWLLKSSRALASHVSTKLNYLCYKFVTKC